MRGDQAVRLILFDIDGTLLDPRGAGRESFTRTLRVVFDIEDDLHYVHFAGATDLNLLNEVLRNHGLKPTKSRVRDFFVRLPIELERALKRHVAVSLPGAIDLLRTLAGLPNTVLGLLTGNAEPCAHIKLQHCGFESPFAIGAFGSEHGQREELARLALQRARQHLGKGFHIDHAFVVGDAPADVAAARVIDATVLAVATGFYDRRSLEQLGADHVVDDLRDTSVILRLLGIEESELCVGR